MAESIPGGAYLSTDGTTWVDAEGRPLDKALAAEAQVLHEERAAQLEEAERQQVLLDAKRDPTARALMAMQSSAGRAGSVEPPAPARPSIAPSGRKSSSEA